MFGVTVKKEKELAKYMNCALDPKVIKEVFKGLDVAVWTGFGGCWEVKEFIHRDDKSYDYWKDHMLNFNCKIVTC